jgi:hypothetical protein
MPIHLSPKICRCEEEENERVVDSTMNRECSVNAVAKSLEKLLK